MEINFSNFRRFKDVLNFLRSHPSEIYYESELISYMGAIVVDIDWLKFLWKESI